jgi:hypothetical protein
MLHVRSGLGFQEEKERRKTFNKRRFADLRETRNERRTTRRALFVERRSSRRRAFFIRAHDDFGPISQHVPAFFVVPTSLTDIFFFKKAKIENEWRRSAGTPRRCAWLSQLYKTSEIRRSL